MSRLRPPRRAARLVSRTLVVFGLCVGLGLVVTSSGCAHRQPPVRPWQREHLAKRGMRFDQPGELAEDRFRQHWLGAREGSDLGFGEPGGGCGCN